MTKRPSSATPPLRVVELFAGVGGFRLGLERAGGFRVVFSDQWEPGRKRQHAAEVYTARFGKAHFENKDIAEVAVEDVPECDVLVGGFPCQDYSVASTLKNSKGLVGKKGVLWWQIHRLLSGAKAPPAYLVLENVDRLLGSPVGQRGRDLAVMLRSLDLLGYAVEWRVINAAEHGMPQRRRRVFIVGYHRGTPKYKAACKATPADWLSREGTLARALPCSVTGEDLVQFSIAENLDTLSRTFGKDQKATPFRNAGIMVQGHVFTGKAIAADKVEPMTLRDVLQREEDVPTEFFIRKKDLGRWKYLKGSKSEPRTVRASGHRYHYSEGAMVFPDALDRPSRTIVTGEGGSAPSRFKHVVRTPSGRYRRLTPIELERLNMFPDDHTKGVSDTWRAFFMGNALVVGVVERIGKELRKEATSVKGGAGKRS
ncbi:MAG: DNA (cytosine-5-)-methyltransferase [Flavobacteriales bacterium]|jgi:DNA (cytosine-5)-methyltransferase 1|nr:DNA (cytosine-5-)-methyltransferase [Flavobacteriales bacterium]MBK6752227.1 DNA (cytosine-5-)-methyltransferase [Flavobacteriales bacterium]MBK7086247.1 DNA (cytosine-5-)-methyltransferase [Flavobacteriales bacterium]MBK7752315.1 DNA (cytosine-5-)-methyltransferase [Flavobacteriales bacterium]MBK9074197.1 DNA (cytosine-5-)-methyltransferase [Flavobacteriales bacterium]